MSASEPSLDPPASPYWSTARWVLRIGVCLQGVGLARWWIGFDETPLFEWLWVGEEGGGLGWSETEALALQKQLGWVALGCGLISLLRPSLLVTGPLVLLEAVTIYAMLKTNYGYSLERNWVAPHVERWFPLGAHAARVVAPLGLILIDPFWGFWRKGSNLPPGRIRAYAGMQLMRIAIAATFAIHGMEALQLKGPFVDLLIGTSQRWFGWEMTQSVAEQILTIIGYVDLGVAGACLMVRSRLVCGWLALWGFLTALSRISAGGFEYHWHETLWRASHFCIPVTLGLYWCALRKRTL